MTTNNPHAFPPSDVSVHHSSASFAWQASLELQDKDVLNGFFLYSLLLDHAELGSVLHVDHDALSQKDRLRPALKERNVRMEGFGQEEYAHACELCYMVSKNENGQEGEPESICSSIFIDLLRNSIVKIQAAICDGHTIGHPCCAVHDCKDDLLNHHGRFCAPHNDLNLQCSVTECLSPVETGFRTCSLPDHRALEDAYLEKGTSLFKLQQRLDKVTSGNAAKSQGGDDSGMVELECDGKPEVGNRKLKAYFGRRRTHNEQIIMRPCGVILSRATFYGSEAVSSVNVSLTSSGLALTYMRARRLSKLLFRRRNLCLSFLSLTITVSFMRTYRT